MKAKWSNLIRLKELEDHPEIISARPGIYIIMKGKVVSRIGGVDPYGILYVGQGINLRDRLKKFLKSDHIASDFLRMNLPLTRIYFGKGVKVEDDLYPLIDNLYARILTPIKGRGKLDEAEWATLFAYLSRFGELPPLNFSMRKRWEGKPKRAILNWVNQGLNK